MALKSCNSVISMFEEIFAKFLKVLKTSVDIRTGILKRPEKNKERKPDTDKIM